MTDIQKFFSDAQKIIKHDRSDHNGKYDGIRASKSISELFVHDNSGLGDLPQSISNYWLTTFIENSSDPANEPTENHLEKLGAMQAFIDGSNETETLSDNEWKELARLVNFEAESLPLDTLSSMMSVLLSKKAL